MKYLLTTTLLFVNAAQATDLFQMDKPIDCKIGENCWISRYFNHGTANAPKDYKGGRLTDSDHQGIDFALSSYEKLSDGVNVIAVADGIVEGVRDGEEDIKLPYKSRDSIIGKECGNGIMLSHTNGYSTQYCHLKKGSLKVKTGDKLKRGDIIGQVGLSGQTEYPHMHLSVYQNKKQIDPFLPVAGKYKEGRTLWSIKTQQELTYEPGSIFNYGIDINVPQQPYDEKLKHHNEITDPERIIGWAMFFKCNEGSSVSIELKNPKDQSFHYTEQKIPSYKARYILFAGKKKMNNISFEKGKWKLITTYKDNQAGIGNTKEIEFLVQ